MSSWVNDTWGSFSVIRRWIRFCTRLAGFIYGKGLLEDLFRLITFLSKHPESGDVIPGTGGIRKLRWKVPGSGKRGGARVIYYYYNENMPVFALTIYRKASRETLTKQQEKELANISAALVDAYRR